MLIAALPMFSPDFFRVVLEVAILFLGIYGILYYFRETRGSLIMAGLVILWGGLSFLSRRWELSVLEHVIDVFGNSLVLILLIVFQPEVRRILAQLGSYTIWRGKLRKELIREIVTAASYMSRRKCGALIVVEKRFRLQTLINDSVPLDAQASALLLEAIFFPNSPLHDGAVILREDRIVAARSILPLARAEHISRRLGTRHRAALGLSEECDAVIVIVSEETGMIGIAYKGALYRDFDPPTLRRVLIQMLASDDEKELNDTLRMLESKNEAKDPAV